MPEPLDFCFYFSRLWDNRLEVTGTREPELSCEGREGANPKHAARISPGLEMLRGLETSSECDKNVSTWMSLLKGADFGVKTSSALYGSVGTNPYPINEFPSVPECRALTGGDCPKNLPKVFSRPNTPHLNALAIQIRQARKNFTDAQGLTPR